MTTIERREQRAVTADRVAAALLAAASLVPLTDAVRFTLDNPFAAKGCGDLCFVVLLLGWLLGVLGVVGIGLAWSIWIGTRLGRLVGFVVVLAGTVWFASRVATLAAAGFAVGDAEMMLPAGLAIAFSVASLCLALSIRAWVIAVRAARA